MIDSFNPGGLPHEPTSTDFLWSDLGAALPPNDRSVEYDIEDELGIKLPINDQSETSCGGHAFSKYNAVREALKTGSYEERSAAFIYKQTAVFDNQGNAQGSRIRDNAEIDYNQGVCLESVCPTSRRDADIFGITITEAMRSNAKLSQGESYMFVNPRSIDDVAQAIKFNGGVVVLLRGENNGTWYSAFPQPPSTRQWGHFMYFGKVRWINGKYYVGGLQSWGDKVGDRKERGWQWFGEEWFDGGIEAVVAIVMKSLPVPTAYQFTRDLTVGSRGADVKILQAYLNKQGYKIASTGPGAPGQETEYFGSLTRSALAKFQAAHGITPSVGFFGPKTRGYINTHQ